MVFKIGLQDSECISTVVSVTKSDEGSKLLFFFKSTPPTTMHTGNKKKDTKQGVKTIEGRTNPKQKEY